MLYQKIRGSGSLKAFSSPSWRYLAASLLLEGPGDERRVALDDRHVLHPPALRQVRVGGDLDELQAHLLPQGPRQAAELTLSFGQIHRGLAVLPGVCRGLPKGLRDAPHHGVGEAAIRTHVGHVFTERLFVKW